MVDRGRPSKKESKGKQKGRSKSRGSKKVIKCFYCHGEGHMKKDCSKRKERDKKQEDGGYANFVGRGGVSVDGC